MYPAYTWRMPAEQRKVYLTFDDGPTPEVTDWVLEQLDKYAFTATFFLIGDMVRKHPEMYQKLVDSPHSIGNHTYHHLNGWKTPVEEYLQNTARCAQLVESKLFRPPYGRVTRKQGRALQQQGYQLIMWDIVSADWDQQLDAKTCAKNVIKNLQPGSIIVFHDSQKAWPRLKLALPEVLQHLKEENYVSEAIPQR